MQPYLQVEHLTKTFGDRMLFEDISFSIGEGQHVALIAQNGLGKTTLLNILSGEENYDEGQVIYRRDLRVGYLRQHPSFPSDMTVLEACLNCDNAAVRVIERYEKALAGTSEVELAEATAEMDAHKAWNYESRIKQILGKLRINNELNQLIGRLSGGQLKRVALANVLIAEPELIILDEPTNHLDLEMVEWLEDFLRRSTTAILMVTHDRYFLDHVCSDILEIDGHRLYHYKGSYAYYLEKRAERVQVHNAETERYRNIYRRELEWMRRMPQARGHKSQYRIEQFGRIEERARERVEGDSMRLEVKSSYIGSKIFEAKYISKSYGDLVILKDFYYNFSRYEKLGIVGKNGSGKSTFVKLLLGLESLDSGSFDIGQTVRFGYYRQEGLAFDDRLKVIDVVQRVAEVIDLGGGRRLTASQFLQHFLFSPQRQHDYVYKLSGGERQRLHLCSVLMQNPNFLVLDEPTNDLDIATLNILEDYLQHFHGCLIVVSHDRYFMDKVVDHLLVFRGEGAIEDFPGNYTQYRQAQEVSHAPEKDADRKLTGTKNENSDRKHANESKMDSAQTSSQRETAQTHRKLTYKEQQELRQVEADMPLLQKEKQQIEQQLSGMVLTEEQIVEVSRRYDDVVRRLDQLEMRWLELSEI